MCVTPEQRKGLNGQEVKGGIIPGHHSYIFFGKNQFVVASNIVQIEQPLVIDQNASSFSWFTNKDIEDSL